VRTRDQSRATWGERRPLQRSLRPPQIDRQEDRQPQRGQRYRERLNIIGDVVTLWLLLPRKFCEFGPVALPSPGPSHFWIRRCRHAPPPAFQLPSKCGQARGSKRLEHSLIALTN
jgi:hypothetical protein